ncbi:MAG: hypothetical protein ACTHJU_02460 [Sphingopyxis sp.]
MTARQPRTPQEAAMLDPMGLMAFPDPLRRTGLFGSSSRRASPPYGIGTGSTGLSVLNATNGPEAGPPGIDQAPPPPADWKNTLGPEMLANLPADGGNAPLIHQLLPPTPPMRGGPLSASMPRGLIGQRPPTLGDAAMSDKIGNRGAPIDANGPGKKGFDWRMLAGVVGDALLGLNGQQPLYAMTRIKENQAQADHRRRLSELAQEWQYRNNQPDYATVGNRRFSFNPATGEATTLYVAPSEAQDYAAALGAEPGSPEYETLMSDYVLRHSGPTATANAMMEEDNRQENRIGLEGVRQKNRIGIEGIRQGNRMSLRGTPTYRDMHPRPSTARSGGGKGAPGGIREGQTATNPQTGAKVVYSGGKWVPAR